MGSFVRGRARTKHGKDAGSGRTRSGTGATEDVAGRRFAAGRAHNGTRGRGHYLVLAVFALAACGGGEDENPAAERCPTEGKDVAIELLDRTKTYTVTMRTNLGMFAVTLDTKRFPCTTASFAALVRDGFFNGTRFHRIVPGFVIQGGDPTGTGTGGPGYTVRDVPPIDTTYEKGVVAMAKTPTAPRGTSGSQFFVVTKNALLPPDYAVLGRVSRGLDVVERIGRLGRAADEQPTREVVVERMTISP
jgi:cyclophilin family peptidyl-prolyl cis-trans isomerase